MLSACQAVDLTYKKIITTMNAVKNRHQAIRPKKKLRAIGSSPYNLITAHAIRTKAVSPSENEMSGNLQQQKPNKR